MRLGKWTILALTAVFAAMFMAAAMVERADEEETDAALEETTKVLFSVLASSQTGKTEEIACWQSETEEYYIFLPSYASLDRASFRIPEDSGDIYLNGVLLTDGMGCEGFALDTAYDLSWDGERGKLWFVQSGNVPTMYIDVRSGSMDYIHASKDNWELGAMRLYDSHGASLWDGELQSINGRGHFTWNRARQKMPYSLGLAAAADLLDMGLAKDWILLANAYDPSNLRNKIVMDFALEWGMAYSPQCRWVDLYLNGSYAGLYLLCERNQVHPQRVDLKGDVQFLISRDLEDRFLEKGCPYVKTELDGDTALRIRSSTVSNDTVRQICQSVENAISAEDGVDPVTGKHYRERIDEESWVKKYLIEEVFGNLDGGRLSQFFYYDSADGQGKLYAGPVWDYDTSMANHYSYWSQNPQILWCIREGYRGTPWYTQLYYQEDFYDLLTRTYGSEALPGMQTLLDEQLDAYREQIAPAAEVNQIRWQTWNDLDFDQAVEDIRTYLTQRLDFLTGFWLKGEPYCLVRVRDYKEPERVFAISPGELLPVSLPDRENEHGIRALGWINGDTGEAFNPDEPIYQDMTLLFTYEELNQQQEQPSAETQEPTREPIQEPAQEEIPLRWPAIPAVLAMMFLGILGADYSLRRKERSARDGQTEKISS